jgi:maltose O-acetyltransferase
MKTEKEKMLSGELYNTLDQDLIFERTRTRRLLQELNENKEDHPAERARLLQILLPQAHPSFWLQPPFYCDYGSNIWIGENVFFNFNCLILDVMQVNIGSRSLFGPNVQIYTATHPVDWQARATGVQFAKPVTIGEDVWIGGGTVICPGVTIGERTVIGAGSLITKNIPSNVLAAGNPCQVVRTLLV